HLPRLLDDLLRPRAVPVVLPGDRADLLLGEVVRHLAQVLLLVGQREIDHGTRLLRRGQIDWSVNTCPQGSGGQPRTRRTARGAAHARIRTGDPLTVLRPVQRPRGAMTTSTPTPSEITREQIPATSAAEREVADLL